MVVDKVNPKNMMMTILIVQLIINWTLPLVSSNKYGYLIYEIII